jgi:hypothetical protein
VTSHQTTEELSQTLKGEQVYKGILQNQERRVMKVFFYSEAHLKLVKKNQYNLKLQQKAMSECINTKREGVLMKDLVV